MCTERPFLVPGGSLRLNRIQYSLLLKTVPTAAHGEKNAIIHLLSCLLSPEGCTGGREAGVARHAKHVPPPSRTQIAVGVNKKCRNLLNPSFLNLFLHVAGN